jgi:hypothetical protein
MPTKQQIYKKHARHLGRMLKKDRSFAKCILTIGYLTKNQVGNEVYEKLEGKKDA